MRLNIFSRPKTQNEMIVEQKTTDHQQEAGLVLPDASNDSSLPEEESDFLYIGREAIFDASEKIFSYRFLLRDSGLLPERKPDDLSSSSRLIARIYNQFSPHNKFQDFLPFLPVTTEFVEKDLHELLPKDGAILEFQLKEQDLSLFASISEKLKKSGFPFALDISGLERIEAELLKQASYIIFDVSKNALHAIAQVDKGIKPLNIKRVIRGIATREQFETCKSHGFDYFQGSFFTQTETLSSKRLDPSRNRVLQIFNMVLQQESVDVIESAFKHDVALCYSLLCYINSAGIGLPYKTESIRSAIMMLGYDFLCRWLSLLVYAGIDLAAAQRTLLNTALIRGRLAELLGEQHFSKKEAGQIFVAGMFSLLDTLLGMPLDKGLEKLNLPEEISAALLRQEGPYSPYVQLAIAFETDDISHVRTLCEKIGFSVNDATRKHLEAITWSRQIA